MELDKESAANSNDSTECGTHLKHGSQIVLNADFTHGLRVDHILMVDVPKAGTGGEGQVRLTRLVDKEIVVHLSDRSRNRRDPDSGRSIFDDTHRQDTLRILSS